MKWLAILLCLPCVWLGAQAPSPAEPSVVKTTFYYDNSWRLTSAEKHVFRREAMFDLLNIRFDGEYQDFDRGGNRIGEGFYSRGSKSGFQYEYFPNQQLRSNTEVHGQDFVVWEERTEDGKLLVDRGTGRFTRMVFYPMPDGKWKQGMLEGEFLRGRREGRWTYRLLQGSKLDAETYRNGRLMERWHYTGADSAKVENRVAIVLSTWSLYTDQFATDESYPSLAAWFAGSVAYPATFSRNATMPGGYKNWLKAVAADAQVPDQRLVVWRIDVDALGMITDYNLESSCGDNTTDKNALVSIRAHLEDIFPAVRRGKPVASVLYVPVSGTASWGQYIDANSESALQSLR